MWTKLGIVVHYTCTIQTAVQDSTSNDSYSSYNKVLGIILIDKLEMRFLNMNIKVLKYQRFTPSVWADDNQTRKPEFEASNPVLFKACKCELL